MKELKSNYIQHPIIGTFIVIIISFTLLHFLRLLPIGLLNSYLIAELVVVVIILTLLNIVNGKDELKFSTKGFGYAFKLTWWPLTIAYALGGFALFLSINQGSTVLENPFLVVIESLIFAILVGLFEEGLFRGLLLSSFLTEKGDTFKGILFSCIVSSIIFGFLHVYNDFLGFFINPETFSFIALLQVIGKTLDAGILGFILAVVYLHTHNLWSVASIHALNDFAGFVPNFLFSNRSIAGNYVDTSGSALGIGMLIIYGLQILLMIPSVIYAYSQLKRVPLPQWGLFKVKWFPLNVRNTQKSKAERF